MDEKPWSPGTHHRLHRSPEELERFIDRDENTKVRVEVVQSGTYDDTTSSGHMTARIVEATARYESEHKSERIRQKAIETAAFRRRTGAVLNGKKAGGRSPAPNLAGPAGRGEREAKGSSRTRRPG